MAKVELKAPIVDEIKGYVSDAKSAVLVDYRGLTVEKDTKLRASPLFRHGRPQAPGVGRDVEAEEMQPLHSQGTWEDQAHRRPAHYRQTNPQDRVQQHSDTALHPAHDI